MVGAIRPKRLVAVLVMASLLVCAYQTAAAEPTVLRRVEEAEIQGKKAKVTLYTMPPAEIERIRNIQASRLTAATYKAYERAFDPVDIAAETIMARNPVADSDIYDTHRRDPEASSTRTSELASAHAGGVVEIVKKAQFAEGMLSGAINNWDLFKRGLKDVMSVVSTASRTGTVNLRDTQARYEFWKEQGIYEKYTPGERAFLNRVVMPAAMAIYNAGGIAASFMTGGAIASGLVWGLTAAGIAIGAPVVLGAVLGTVLAGSWVYLTNRKRSQVETAGAEVVGSEARPTGLFQNAWLALKGASWAASGATSFFGGGALIAGEGLAVGVGAGAGILGAGVAGAMGMDATSNMAVTLTNVWGIPETYDVVYGETVTEDRKGGTGGPYQTFEFNLNWRLSK